MTNSLLGCILLVVSSGWVNPTLSGTIRKPIFDSDELLTVLSHYNIILSGVLMSDYILKLDWLSFTYQVSVSDCLNSDGVLESPFCVFCREFPELQIMYDEIVFDTGKFHYSHRFLYSDSIEINCCELEKVSGGSVNFDYACKMGVNVSVPSHSLSLFASLFGLDISEAGACSKLLSLLKFRGCKFSRIDICFDDFDKVYTANDYCCWWFNGQISTRFQKAHCDSSQSRIGSTFYLGDRKHRMIRIYDKFYESKGVVDSVRYEWEYHAADACKLADMIILNNGNIGFITLLQDWLRILIKPCKDLKNRAEVATLPEWDLFCKEHVFNEELIIPTYDKKERESRLNDFVEFRVMPSIRGMIAVVGIDQFLRCVKRDSSKISERYHDYISKVSKRGDFTPFDINSIVCSLDEEFV